jgi:hypothetical protein
MAKRTATVLGPQRQHGMTGNSSDRHVKKARPPSGEHGGLPCKKHHCQWQQRIEDQAAE